MINDIASKITVLSEKNKKLNALRIKRAVTNSNYGFKHILELLPLCFHINNPNLFGYVTNAPIGVANFKFSNYQQKFLKTQNINIKNKENNIIHPAIDALYIMGSTSSVAQTPKSDIDIWVCYADNLSTYEIERLQNKCQALSQWANSFKIEVNFYLIDKNYFKKKNNKNFSDDNCGTAQQALLLDEFYRTSIQLAGKPLLWLHIAIENDKLYQKTVKDLVKANLIDLNDWIDFGGFTDFVANEFFGASLWQMYKAIDNPHKSLIKIMLLEAYSYFYPDIRVLAIDFKKNLISNDELDQFCDSYMFTLRRIRKYLLKENQIERLNLVRKCFYSKCIEGYTSFDKIPKWKTDLLKQIIKMAKWSKIEVDRLNNQFHWKAGEVARLNQLLFDNLNYSYKKLHKFAKDNKINFSINSGDINLLTRKLLASFNYNNNKIELIKYNMSKNIEENSLHLIEVTKHKSLKKGWYISNLAYKATNNYNYNKYNKSILGILGWAYFNHVWTEQTKLLIYNSSIPQYQLDLLAYDIRTSLPNQFNIPTEYEYANPADITMLFVAINLTKDPTTNLKINFFNKEIKLLDIITDKKKSIIGSLDFILRNSWGEIKVFSYQGSGIVLKGIKDILNNSSKKYSAKRLIKVVSYSEQYSSLIELYATRLIKKCLSLPSKKIVNLEDLSPILKENLKFYPYVDKVKYKLEHLSNTQQKNLNKILSLKKNSQCMKSKISRNVLNKIENFAIEGVSQFFFEDFTNHYHLYILDEKNSLKVVYELNEDREKIVKTIYQIYNEEKQQNDNLFNFPQVYQLTKINNRFVIVPFNSKQQASKK